MGKSKLQTSERKCRNNSLFSFTTEVINNLKSIGRIRTSETYAATLRSFRRFLNDKDITIAKISPDLMIAYETFLRDNGLCPNSSSFYMRNLRAIYNRAVEKGLTAQRFPFKYVYTGIDKTIKRAITLKELRLIKSIDLSADAVSDFARDMFLFSFYTRGMSFIDMAYLRKRDLANGILSYRRRKTDQQLFIKWENCMQEIVDKYACHCSGDYLLPIINPIRKINERQQYLYSSHKINKRLKAIGEMLRFPFPLTMYVARHSWASIAKRKNIPISIISEGMGHESESTTRIYLASFDTDMIDKANNMILRSL